MSEDKANLPSSGDNIKIEGSSAIAVNEGTVNVDRIIINPPPTEKTESPQKISPQAVAEFLQAIETRFQYLKLFHVPQERVLLQDQYIPIEVTLERRYKHDIETIRGYAESEAELPKIYAPKRMAEETRKEQVKWEEARKKHQKLIVLADPGMGKSTLLKMEALRIAGKQLDPPKSPLEKGTLNQNLAIDEIVFPLFLRLSDLAATEKEVIEIVPELIKRDYATAAAIEPLLKEKLKQGKCVLLLDALDEVDKEERLELGRKLNRFASNNNKCPIVCTSRIVGYGGGFLDGAKEVEIVPFNKQQREAYITSWFTNAAEYLEDETVSAQGLIRELQQKPQISGLAQNPLLLSLLCSLYQVKELELPARRTQIYHQAVKYMLRDWSKENERKLQQEGWVLAKTELLEFLAYQLSCENKEVFLLADVRENLNQYLSQENKADFQQFSVADLLDELTEADGIIQKLSRDGDYYLFLHRTFQEYLTASYLQKKIGKNQRQGIKLVIDHIWEYDWHETIVLVAGLMENPMPLMKAISRKKDDIFNTLLLLVGLCLAECDAHTDPLANKIIKKIGEFWQSYPDASFITSVLVALGKNNYLPVIKFLIIALRESKSYARASAVEVLGKIDNKQAMQFLIATLQDFDYKVRISVAEALGKIGSDQAIEPLIAALQDSDDYVRISVAEALGKIGTEQAIEPLIAALQDSDDYVRMTVAEALGKIDNDQVIEPLIAALQDSDPLVKIHAAYALGKIGNEQAIESLITNLQDSYTVVGINAAKALVKLGNEKGIQFLIATLQDSDPLTRMSAAEALGKIGTEQAIKPLITTLQDSGEQVVIFVIFILIQKGLHRLASLLLQNSPLQDSNSLMRTSTAEVLGKLDNEQRTQSLSTTLKNSNLFERISVIEALGKVGSQEILEELIYNEHIDIYDKYLFPTARKLAVRYSRELLKFIPVYPHLVHFYRFRRLVTIFLITICLLL